MKRCFITVLILLSALFGKSVFGGENIFRKIVEDYLSVKTIKASIVQYIYPEDGSTEIYSGYYFASSGGHIRIEYLKPEKQVVVVNNSGLYWYYPERKLLFFSEKKKGGMSSVPILMDIIPAESLKGVEVIKTGRRFYSLFKMADVYSITSLKNKTVITLWVDPFAGIIKRKVISDDSGREMIIEEYKTHTLVKGVYIPAKIELTARTFTGVVQTVTEYENLVINSPIDKDVFKFKVTDEMKVRMINEH